MHTVTPATIRLGRLALLPSELRRRACDPLHLARVCQTVEIMMQQHDAVRSQERDLHTCDVAAEKQNNYNELSQREKNLSS